MFTQVCYIIKNGDGYYYGNNGSLVFEDSSSAKRFFRIDDIKKEIESLDDWNILEVEFGFRVIRNIDPTEYAQ